MANEDTQLYEAVNINTGHGARALKKSPFLRTKTEKCYDL